VVTEVEGWVEGVAVEVTAAALVLVVILAVVAEVSKG